MSKSTRWCLVLVLVSLSSGLGCKEEKEPETSVQQKSVADRFTDNLAATEFVKYALGISGGGRLVYQRLEFRTNGSWVGEAELLLADEPYSCTERGKWQLENDGPVDEENGRVILVMEQTDCPGRDAPEKRKIEVRLKGKGGRPEIIDL